MSDNSYSSDAVNVLTIQNGITFLTSLMSLVTRTQLDWPKIKGLLKHVDTLFGKIFEVLHSRHYKYINKKLKNGEKNKGHL